MDVKLNSCRICFEQEGLKSIFEKQDNIYISKKIVYCASVQISEDDMLPKMICGHCLFYLDIAYAFRIECESTDRRIRSLHINGNEGISKDVIIESDAKYTKPTETDRFLNHISDEAIFIQYCEDTQDSDSSEIVLEKINILDIKKSILDVNVPKLYTEFSQTNILNEDSCLQNSGAIEARENSKSKVGRHIAKKISGKLPQRLRKKSITTSDNKSLSYENHLNGKVVLNNVYHSTRSEKDGVVKFEEVLESHVPMVVSEEIVITDDNFSYQVESDDTSQSQENRAGVDYKNYTNVSSDKLKRKIVKKLKINSKLKMILRKGNRKVNVFKNHFKDAARKHKRTSVKHLKNTGEVDKEIEKTKDGFKCDICHKQFPYRSHLKRHLNKHTGAKLYTCKFCKQKFVNNYNLNVHMSKHTGEFPLKCEICNKGLPNPSLLKRHMTSHTGEQQFQCHYCSAKFRQSSSLRCHEKMHLNRPSYHCDICFKVFSYTNSLTAHKKLHFGAQRFPCNICLSTFSRKSSLVRHMGEHTKSKRIKCKFCSLFFPSKSTYNSHLKTHCKYECETCGEGFRYKSNFTDHIKHHKN